MDSSLTWRLHLCAATAEESQDDPQPTAALHHFRGKCAVQCEVSDHRHSTGLTVAAGGNLLDISSKLFRLCGPKQMTFFSTSARFNIPLPDRRADLRAVSLSGSSSDNVRPDLTCPDAEYPIGSPHQNATNCRRDIWWPIL